MVKGQGLDEALSTLDLTVSFSLPCFSGSASPDPFGYKDKRTWLANHHQPVAPSGPVMEKVVEYFHYWYRNQEKVLVADMEIPVEMCLELLVAADYLGLDSKLYLSEPIGCRFCL